MRTINYKDLVSFGSNKEVRAFLKGVSVGNKYPIFIGEGSSREVWRISKCKVIKIAINDRGLAQNKVEYKISKKDTNRLVAKVRKAHPKFSWLISDYAVNINEACRRYFVFTNQDKLKSLGLLIEELCDYGQVGKIGNRIVIKDYGFTDYIYRKYYYDQ